MNIKEPCSFFPLLFDQCITQCIHQEQLGFRFAFAKGHWSGTYLHPCRSPAGALVVEKIRGSDGNRERLWRGHGI
jgi:hypothetical protein